MDFKKIDELEKDMVLIVPKGKKFSEKIFETGIEGLEPAEISGHKGFLLKANKLEKYLSLHPDYFGYIGHKPEMRIVLDKISGNNTKNFASIVKLSEEKVVDAVKTIFDDMELPAIKAKLAEMKFEISYKQGWGKKQVLKELVRLDPEQFLVKEG